MHSPCGDFVSPDEWRALENEPMHVDRFIEPGPKKVTLGPAELGAEATRVSIRVVEPKSIDQSAPDTEVVP